MPVTMSSVTGPRPRVRGVRSCEAWRQALRLAVRDAVQLCRLLDLPSEWEAAAERVGKTFPVFAPRGYLARIRPGDPLDPLLRQILPLADELHALPAFSRDPVGDAAAARSPGLLQKYHGRALMIATGACAVHCRYCFRRHFPYQEDVRSPRFWAQAISEIAADASLEEIVLSGGDPLTLTDERLAALAGQLAAVPHLRRLRVHTRLPVVIPERVTPGLVGLLRSTRLTPVVVLHANHPRELDSSVADALARLVDAGIPLLNQSVLLRGVNDDAPTLVALSQRLLDCRVLPYYLHQLDRVAGAGHFEVAVDRGLALVAEMRARLPGYAVPRYVREVPGQPGKVVLA
jgi:L-lysine 2,3-aminomutase